MFNNKGLMEFKILTIIFEFIGLCELEARR